MVFKGKTFNIDKEPTTSFGGKTFEIKEKPTAALFKPEPEPPKPQASLWEKITEKVPPTAKFLPGAVKETFKKAFPGFSDENIKNLAERNEAWEKLSFIDQVKLFGGELGKNLGEFIKSFPRDAVQFIATPTIGSIEEIYDMSIGEVELPTKVGEWIGPLTGTRTQLEQFKKQGIPETEAQALVVTQQMARSLPFVLIFGAPAYVEALIRRPQIETVYEVKIPPMESHVTAVTISKTARLPKATVETAIRTELGAFSQSVRIKGHPNKYIIIHTRPDTGMKAYFSFEISDPVLQIQTLAYAKRFKLPEIPLPKGVEFPIYNPAVPGMTTWIRTTPVRAHSLILEESLKRILPTIIKKKPAPLPKMVPIVPALPITPPVIPPEVVPKPLEAIKEVIPVKKPVISPGAEVSVGSLKVGDKIIWEGDEYTINKRFEESIRLEDETGIGLTLPMNELVTIPMPKKVLKAIPKELEPLTEGKGVYYHGSPVSGIKEFRVSQTGTFGKGVYLSKSKNTAREAAATQADGNLADINLYSIKTNAKLYKTSAFSLEDSEILNIRKKGYGGIETPAEVVIFDPKEIRIVKETPAEFFFAKAVKEIKPEVKVVKPTPPKEMVEPKEIPEELESLAKLARTITTPGGFRAIVRDAVDAIKPTKQQKMITSSLGLIDPAIFPTPAIESFWEAAQKAEVEITEEVKELLGIKPKAPTELEQLAVEARKFKSAEDFIQSVRLKSLEKSPRNAAELKSIKAALAKIPENKLAEQTVELLHKKYPGIGWFEAAQKFYTKATIEVKEKVIPKAEKPIPYEITTKGERALSIKQTSAKATMKTAPAGIKKGMIEKKIFDTFLPIISGKQNLPILENIGIKGNKVMATNLETGLIYYSDVDLKINNAIPRDVLRGKGLADLPEIIEATKGKLLDIKDFPLIPEQFKTPTAKAEISLDSEVLKKLISAIDPTKYTRPEITGIYFHSTPQGLTLAATDSFRLWQITLPYKVPPGFRFILPAVGAQKLVKVLDKVNPEKMIVEVSEKEYQVIFSFDKFKFVTRLIEGEYPDYAPVLPKEVETFFEVDRAGLLGILREAKPFVDKRIPEVRAFVNTQKGVLKIAAQNLDIGKFNKEISIVIRKEIKNIPADDQLIIMPIGKEEGAIPLIDEKEMSYNWNFLKDFLEKAQTSQVMGSMGKITEMEKGAPKIAPAVWKEISGKMEIREIRDLGKRIYVPKVREGQAEYIAEKIKKGSKEPYIKRKQSFIRIQLRDKGYLFGRGQTVEGPDDVADLLRELKNSSREKNFSVNLDENNRILNIDNNSIGSINAALVDPAEVLKAAILSGAKKIYFIHNHPSGDVTPSMADIGCNIKIERVAKELGIKTQGYLIIDRATYGFGDPEVMIDEERTFGERVKSWIVKPMPSEVLRRERMRMVEIEQKYTKLPDIMEGAILQPDDVVNITKLITDKTSPTIVAFYLDARLKINGIEIIDFTLKYPHTVGRRLMKNAILNNATTVLLGTNLPLNIDNKFGAKNVGAFQIIEDKLGLLNIELADVVGLEGAYSLKRRNLLGEGRKIAEGGEPSQFIREEMRHYVYKGKKIPAPLMRGPKGRLTEMTPKDITLLATRNKISYQEMFERLMAQEERITGVREVGPEYETFSFKEKEVLALLTAGKPIPERFKDVVKALQDKGIIRSTVRAKIKKLAPKETLPGYTTLEQIEKVQASITEQKIPQQVYRQILNGFTGHKRTRVKELTEAQADELYRALLELTPDQFGRIKAVKPETLEALRDFIPPSLFTKEVVTTGDVFRYLDENDVNYLLSLTRFAYHVLGKGTPMQQKIYNKVSEAEEDRHRDYRNWDKEKKKLIREALKEDKNAEMNAIGHIEQDWEVLPKTKELADFATNWWAESLPVMKPRRLRERYVTHTPLTFREKIKANGIRETVKSVLGFLEREPNIPPEILGNLEYILSKKKFNPFALPRSQYTAYSKSIDKAMDAYAQVYFYKKHFDPIMPTILNMKRFQPVATQKYITKWLQNIGGRPLDYIWEIGRKGRYIKMARRASHLMTRWEYIKLLGLNSGSGIANVIGGTLNNWSRLSYQDFIRGHRRLLTLQGHRILANYGLTQQSMWLEPVGGLQRGLTKAERGLFMFMQVGEIYLRGIPALSQIPKNEFETGVLSSETRTKIRREIALTQGIYGPAQTPLMAQTIIGRPIYQYKLWAITEMELMYDFSKDTIEFYKRNPGLLNNPINNPGLRRWIKFLMLTIPLFIWGFQKGRETIEIYPWLPIWFWKTVIDPKETPVGRDLYAVSMFFMDLIQGNIRDAKQGWAELQTFWPVFVKRGAAFYQAATTGEVTTPYGTLQEQVTVDEALKRLALGSQTEQRQKFIALHRMLSKLLPQRDYIEWSETFGAVTIKTDYQKNKEDLIRLIKNKGYRSTNEIDKDKQLIARINAYNKQAVEKLKKFFQERDKMTGEITHQKEWETYQKKVSVQKDDINRWFETEEALRTIPSILRRTR